ncbi:MAG: NAD(P)/FAD-dependent oxidoreductase [Acidobacteriia bacterium]|nr:NAD(P)/FAD-dependent oxidoreductase [Terriglobia bacterium]
MAAYRVIILGGGFGGLYAARAMRNAPVELKLIDRRNFHLFQPLLYQVATGSLSPGEICAPLRGILSRQRNTQVLLGEAVDIDPHARTIQLLDGGVFPYDSLIVSTGSQTSYFGKDQWRTWAPSLKSVEEATAIRHKILYAFEAAERETDPAARAAWMTFVIVGGGTTGVELAGALGEIAGRTLKNEFRDIDPKAARILMLDAAPRLLTAYPPDLATDAEESLKHLGVSFRPGVKVVDVDGAGVSIEDEKHQRERIPTKTVLWAGGVNAGTFGRVLAERTHAATDRSGRFMVKPDLTLPGFPEIFVVGDLADIPGPDGNPLPGVAQVAMQGGAYAAKSITARVKGEAHPAAHFHYSDRGDIAVIGRAAAVARIFGWHLHGLLAWLVWLFIHLMYLVQFQNRVLVFIQWGFQYLTFSRGARLITGSAVANSVNPGPTMRNLAEE